MGKGEKIPKLILKLEKVLDIIVGPFTGYTGKVREVDQEKQN